jgi:hypothetical protein
MSVPIDLQLREYTAFFDSQLPVIDIEDVLTERVGSGAVRPIRPRRPQSRRRWLAAVAAGAAVLVLIGGAAWLAGRPEGLRPATTPVPTSIVPTTTAPAPPTTVPQTTSTPPTTQSDSPAPVAASDALLTWERVEGAPEEAFGPFFSTGSTVGAVVRNGPFDHKVWTSDDLRSWAESDLPVSPSFFEVSIMSTASGRWLIGSGPTGLWFTPHGELAEWREVDVSGLARAVPEGLIAEPNVGRPAQIGDVTLVPVEHRLGIDWEGIFGIAPGTYPVVTIHQETEFTETVVVTGRSPLGSVTLGRVVPRESGDGLALINEATADELFFYPRGIAGIDQEMTSELLNGVSSSSLYAVTAAEAQELDLFQTASGGRPRPSAVQVVEYGGRVIAIGTGDRGIEAWISSDGMDWQGHPAPPFYGDVIVDEQSGFLYSSPIGMFLTHWISNDAVSWTAVDPPDDRFSSLHRLTSGWLLLTLDDQGLLADLGVFIAGADEAQVAIDDSAGAVVHSAVAVGDTILLIGPGSGWLGELSFQP